MNQDLERLRSIKSFPSLVKYLRDELVISLAPLPDIGKIVSKVASTQLTCVSADLEVNAAAVSEGFQLEDPNNR